MNEAEILELLKEKLSIHISDTTEMGPVRKIKITLYLDNEEITSDYFNLAED